MCGASRRERSRCRISYGLGGIARVGSCWVLPFVPCVNSGCRNGPVVTDVGPRPLFSTIYVEMEANLAGWEFGVLSIAENLLDLVGDLSLLSNAKHVVPPSTPPRRCAWCHS